MSYEKDISELLEQDSLDIERAKALVEQFAKEHSTVMSDKGWMDDQGRAKINPPKGLGTLLKKISEKEPEVTFVNQIFSPFVFAYYANVNDDELIPLISDDPEEQKKQFQFTIGVMHPDSNRMVNVHTNNRIKTQAELLKRITDKTFLTSALRDFIFRPMDTGGAEHLLDAEQTVNLLIKAGADVNATKIDKNYESGVQAEWFKSKDGRTLIGAILGSAQIDCTWEVCKTLAPHLDPKTSLESIIRSTLPFIYMKNAIKENIKTIEADDVEYKKEMEDRVEEEEKRLNKIVKWILANDKDNNFDNILDSLADEEKSKERYINVNNLPFLKKQLGHIEELRLRLKQEKQYIKNLITSNFISTSANDVTEEKKDEVMNELVNLVDYNDLPQILLELQKEYGQEKAKELREVEARLLEKFFEKDEQDRQKYLTYAKRSLWASWLILPLIVMAVFAIIYAVKRYVTANVKAKDMSFKKFTESKSKTSDTEENIELEGESTYQTKFPVKEKDGQAVLRKAVVFNQDKLHDAEIGLSGLHCASHLRDSEAALKNEVRVYSVKS